MLNIEIIPAECLRTPSILVGADLLAQSKTQKLIDDLIETMRSAHGVGLAASQVAINQRIIIVLRSGKPIAYINPVLKNLSFAKIDSEEGCLSVPNTIGIVKRHRSLDLSALNHQGHEIKEHLQGFDAIVLQHEVDHLDGILFTDRAYRYLDAKQSSNTI